ncbi:SDR family oxidoreductase [Nocardioides seonyuensis]|uniref:SDR family oxidoreductase n=1 Tax=Nocardioides seonyuensis TaxID=2518371 RepID=A0A4P7IJL4_9ACTN|nr:SDR family oxidoreductase [Nocardioides seonyuensis]QBX56487.1 SDR family oxidoreductase [Nocardioides seonyuensis]
MSGQHPRTHVVTGAGSGIGEVLATRLAERGDSLVLLARSAARAEELGSRFADAQVLVADLADPGMLNGLGREIDGPVDSLVHVAGVVELAEVARLRLQEMEHQLAVNLVAPALLTRELLPHLRAARGTVVFVNSTSGLSASAKWGAYAASKFGLRAMADVLREEEKGAGVRVTSVFPSRTATPMQEQVHEQEGVDYDPTRWIQPATVADMVLHVLDLPEDATVPEVVVRPR